MKLEHRAMGSEKIGLGQEQDGWDSTERLKIGRNGQKNMLPRALSPPDPGMEPKIPESQHSSIISNLHEQFDVWFKDFKALKPHFQLFSTPFAVEIDYVAEEMQMELVELQCDTMLKQKYTDVGIPEFYRFLSQERFPMLFSASARIMFFSSMKINKSVLRSRLADEHLKATLRLLLSQDIKPNIDALVDDEYNPPAPTTQV
uniref:Uncharacterized protein n=1 Tax=Chelonoidis abingdonii TaxID=106734 RepID=A0A8C0GJ75_CHEAB